MTVLPTALVVIKLMVMQNPWNSSSGFSLLEVLIALAIMIQIFLGSVFLQILTLRQIHSARYRSVAITQAAALIEKFRANPGPAGFAQVLALAQPQIQNLLPGGRGEYQCGGPGRACTVLMYWQDHGQQTVTLSSLI